MIFNFKEINKTTWITKRFYTLFITLWPLIWLQVRWTSRKLDSSEVKQCVAQCLVLPYIYIFCSLLEVSWTADRIFCNKKKKLELHHTVCVFSATCIKHDKPDSFVPINYTGWPRFVTLSREVPKAMFWALST